MIALSTGAQANLTATSVTLDGSFVGNGEDVHYYFKWGTSADFSHTTATPPGVDAGSQAGPTNVSFNLTELLPGTAYQYQIIATNASGTTEGEINRFTTPPLPPVITGETASGVQSDLASLHAEIDPDGAETTYHFEFGTEPCNTGPSLCISTPIPDASVGSASSFQGVSVQLNGLMQGTTYHYRVVAKNEVETTYGQDHTFTTYSVPQFSASCPNARVRQQTGAELLPDCRAYELVSAAHTGGYDVESDLAEGQTSFEAYPEAEEPSRFLYAVHNGGIPGTNHPTDRGPDPYVATRGEGGWSTEYVGVPATNQFSTEPFSSSPSGADASLETFAFGGPEGCSPCFEGGYTGIPVRLANGALVQGMSGPINPGPSAKPDGHIAKDLSANGEHFIFGSTAAFAEGGNDQTGDVSIYDHNLKTGQTHVVSNTPEGEDFPEALSCLQGKGQCDSSHKDSNGISELDISSDGSHILLGQKVSEDADGNVYWHLYMDVNDSIRSIDLTPGTTHGVLYDGMTADGSKVFFTTVDKLTTEDTDESADIYEAEVSEGGKATLHLVSSGIDGTGNSDACDPVSNTAHSHWNSVKPEANCGVVAIGGGGGVAAATGTIYFLSPEKLDGSANGVQNAPNLYSARPGSEPRFVATLESFLTGPQPPVTYHPDLRTFGSFSRPSYIAVDRSGGPSNGDVYVVDATTEKIYKFDPSGKLVTAWSNNGQLSSPRSGFGIGGIAVGPDGTLYVSGGNCELFVYAQDGIPKTHITGICSTAAGVDSGGRIYTIGNGGVQRYESSGASLGQLTTGYGATALAFDPSNGDLYVDAGGENIYRYSFNGTGEVIEPGAGTCSQECNPTATIASGTDGGSLAVDAEHNIYVDERDQIVEINPSGHEVGVPAGSGLLSNSGSIAVDSAGHILAANPKRSNIQIFGSSELDPIPQVDNPLVLDAVSSSETRHTDDFQTNPNGQFAVFPSTLSLTGFQTGGHSELYRYDDNTESIKCVSCDTTGVVPTGDSSLASRGLSLTDSGQVFFTSSEPLVEGDGDRRRDVYEWEANDTGSCRSSSDCTSLISSGTSAFDSELLGASANGVDAFFITRDSLSPQDQNGDLVKIYDAREAGGFTYTPPSVPCKASDECHGAGTPAPSPPVLDSGGAHGGNGPSPQKSRCKSRRVRGHHGRSQNACLKGHRGKRSTRKSNRHG